MAKLKSTDIFGSHNITGNQMVAGNSTVEGYLYIEDTNTRLSQGPLGSLDMTSEHGTTSIGMRNTTFTHFYTESTEGFYFADDIWNTGSIKTYGNLYLNFDNSDVDAAVYFGDVASDTDHKLSFDKTTQQFRTSDSLTVSGYIYANSNIYAHENLYLNKNLSNADSAVYFGNTSSASTHSILFDISATQFVLSDGMTMNGDLHINGIIYQSGEAYETHAEQIFTTQDVIYLREGAISALAPGEFVGLIAKIPDGTTDAGLLFDGDGNARVGDLGVWVATPGIAISATEPLLAGNEGDRYYNTTNGHLWILNSGLSWVVEYTSIATSSGGVDEYIDIPSTTLYTITGDGTQTIATREDTPYDNGSGFHGIAHWDEATFKFITNAGATVRDDGSVFANYFRGAAISHQTPENSLIEFLSTGTVISRDVEEDPSSALTVNLVQANATGNIQNWQWAGANKAFINRYGDVVASKYYDISNFDYYLDPSNSTLSLNVASGANLGKTIVIDTSEDADFITGKRQGNPRFNVRYDSTSVATHIESSVNLVLEADSDADSADGYSNIIFKSDDVEHMRLDHDGKLGIGTTSPVAKLEVDGVGFNILSSASLDINAFTGIGFRGYTSVDSIKSGIVKERKGNYGTGKLHILNNIITDSTNADISNAVITIDENNNVGIGTTTPASKLTVSTDVSGDINEVRFGGANGRTIGAYTNGSLSNFDIYANSTYFASNFLIPSTKVIKTSNGDTGDLHLSTDDATAKIYTDRGLSVDGLSRFRSEIYQTDSDLIINQVSLPSSGNVITVDTSGYNDSHDGLDHVFVFYLDAGLVDHNLAGANGTGITRLKYTIDGGSELYIDLLDELQIVGAVQTVALDIPQYDITVSLSGTPNDGTGDQVTVTLTAQTDYIYYHANNVPNFLNKDNGGNVVGNVNITGSVGIGTSNPSGKLQISDVNTGYPTSRSFSIEKEEENYGMHMGISGDGTSWIQSGTTSGNTKYKLTLNPTGGNVGFGIADPGSNLHIYGAGVVKNTIQSSDNQTQLVLSGTLGQVYNATGSLYITNNSAAGDIIFRAGSSTERMRINGENGRVGIGISSPDYQFEVAGTNGNFGVGESGNDLFFTRNAANYLYTTGSSSSFRILTGADKLGFVQDSAGKVGIGVGSPSEKLEVTGNIKGQDMIISDDSDNVKVTLRHDNISKSLKFVFA